MRPVGHTSWHKHPLSDPGAIGASAGHPPAYRTVFRYGGDGHSDQAETVQIGGSARVLPDRHSASHC
jgi:hypothetical protein